MTARPTTRYQDLRYWYLHELRRVAACVEIGTIGVAAAHKERRLIVKKMAEARASRSSNIS